MSDHEARVVERHCDVCVIGGSAAGLAAALQLVRRRRSVIVVDSGERPPSELADRGRDEVRSHGGEILAGRVTRVTRTDDGGFVAELAGGHRIVAPRVLAAAGTVTDPGLQVLGAADDGSRVGAMIGVDLADDDRRATARRSAAEADWDHRYAGAPIWSGNPNGTLVDEVRGLAPGRALDVGAGEGGDALWLAEHGWRVTASDISRRALERIAAEAERRGLSVVCHHADANALEPFGDATFDLVSAQYASIPRTPDGRGVANLLAAVAPGGRLLVVNHDADAMRARIAASDHTQPFDPNAYVQVSDFVTALSDASTWEIEVDETRPRPPGAASASHHVDDVVLRARRRGG